MDTPANLQRIDWNLLGAFSQLVEAGSLAKAARTAGVSQPTLSRQIQALEGQLGMLLFERTARGMRLTAAGHGLVAHAARMQHEADAILRTAQGMSDEVAGVVRISASELTASHILPPILAGIHRDHPSIEFEVIASNEVSNLLEREADIALRMTQPAQSDLVARKVARLDVGIFAHEDYLASHGEPATMAQLLALDLIGYDRDDALRKGLLAAGAPRTALRFAFRSDSHEVCWQMVRAGFGCGFVTAAVAASDPHVRRILPAAPIPALPLWLTTHREVRSSRRLRLVYDALATGLRLIDGPG